MRAPLPELELKGRNLHLGFFKFSGGKCDSEQRLLATRRVISCARAGGAWRLPSDPTSCRRAKTYGTSPLIAVGGTQRRHRRCYWRRLGARKLNWHNCRPSYLGHLGCRWSCQLRQPCHGYSQPGKSLESGRLAAWNNGRERGGW